MIILDKPYVSEFLQDTLLKDQFPVLNNEAVEKLNLKDGLNYWDEEFAIKEIKKNKKIPIYSNSENSINWIINNLSFTDLPDKIELFKDKVKFRELVASIYPNFFFQEINFDELDSLDISKIKKPFIIKPTVGFFSMGVNKVSNNEEWPEILESIKNEIEKVKGLYPSEVMNSSKFIIEENIEGEEFAVDVYFNKDGEPVILNILKHLFSGEKDVSDRVYLTSKTVIQDYLGIFSDLLVQIGKLAYLQNFPMHIEVRVNENKKVIPIEVNPMRFAGWCTTDLAYYAYGINVYEYFFKQLKPDWGRILENKTDNVYSFVIADIPADVNRENIVNVDYDSFLKNFSKPLEVRKIDYHKYPIFCILFAETKDYDELQHILKADLRKYLQLSK